MTGTGAKLGHDIFLGYAPERVDLGNHDCNVRSTPKLFGGGGGRIRARSRRSVRRRRRRDGTAEKVRRLGDPRIQTLRHEHSLGLSEARNAGIRRAAGEWIAFLDDDDLWSPHKSRRQLGAARRAQAAWCYSAAALIDSRGRVGQVLEAPAPASVLPRLRGVNVIPRRSIQRHRPCEPPPRRRALR